MSQDDKHGGGGIFKITLNLTVACLASGVIIAGTYMATADTIKRKEAQMREETMRGLIPGVTAFEELPGHKGWFKAMKDGVVAGYIVPTESKGYGGTISTLCAVSPECKILNFSILKSNETPGLGDKADKPEFKCRLIGKDAAHLKVTKDPADKVDVLAITGATITSKAVTAAVREADEDVETLLSETSVKPPPDGVLRKLVPGATAFEPISTRKSWFKAMKGQVVAAYLVPSEGKGYGGTMKLLCAVSPDGKILDFVIVESKETTGYVDQADTSEFKARIIGKTASNLKVTHDPSDKAHVQSITGATLTSEAVVSAARAASEEVLNFMKDGK